MINNGEPYLIEYNIRMGDPGVPSINDEVKNRSSRNN